MRKKVRATIDSYLQTVPMELPRMCRILCTASLLLFIAPDSPSAWAEQSVGVDRKIPEETEASKTKDKPDEIKLSLFGHRRVPNLYWRIDESGKGEISAPYRMGYGVTAPLIINPAYSIAPGLHSFDIGSDGYQKLRRYLGQVIDSEVDYNGLVDGECALRNAAHDGSIEMFWSGSKQGELSLPHQCLNAIGQQFKDRMLFSWYEIAILLHGQNRDFVQVRHLPAKRAPDSLRFTKKDIWTAVTSTWQIDGRGRGWIEFSDDLGLPSLATGENLFIRAGRYRLKLDHEFHQAILRELDPYLSQEKTVGSCEDEISITDQPMVRIEWKGKDGKPASFASDLGCPTFAARFRNVELAFAELMRNRTVGGSRLLDTVE